MLPDLSFEPPARSGLEHVPTWISPVRDFLQKWKFSETGLSAKSNSEQPQSSSLAAFLLWPGCRHVVGFLLTGQGSLGDVDPIP